MVPGKHAHGRGTVSPQHTAARQRQRQPLPVPRLTLDNVNNTIQGEGIIYNNGTTMNNKAGGTILANSTGCPLANALALEYGTFNNQGLIEATNNGDLHLYSTTVNNAGGNISINGSGTSVALDSTTILGGTLNNNGGAFFGNASRERRIPRREHGCGAGHHQRHLHGRTSEPNLSLRVIINNRATSR